MKGFPPKNYFTSRTAPRGFTIVELVIVVVVVAILAAVITVAYNGITSGAREASLKSDLERAAGELTRHQLKFKSYPNVASELNDGQGLIGSGENELTYSRRGGEFCLAATHPKLSGSLTYESSTGKISDGDCRPLIASISSKCAVADSKAYCWGSGSFGALGNGSTANSDVPVPVRATGVLLGKSVTAISSGTGSNSCVIADSQAYCWGRGLNGMLGRGSSTSNSSIPVAVSAIPSSATVTDVSVGGSHACLIADGRVHCWGKNSNGQLGDYSTNDSGTPRMISGIFSGGKIATSVSVGYSHTCAVVDAMAYCWGAGGFGKLGRGSGYNANRPYEVSTDGALNGKTVTAVSTGEHHSCALADGKPYCWGWSVYGRIGDGVDTVTQHLVPVAVDTSGVLAGKTVSAITSGRQHTCVIADGDVYCWGDNSQRQLGTGAAGNSWSPVAVKSDLWAGKKVSSITAGSYFTCAVADGHAFCWGLGQNGDPGTTGSVVYETPVSLAPMPSQ